jgi:hypothetical protein
MTEYAPITVEVKRKILGLNAASLYDIDVPAELRLATPDPGHGGGRRRRQGSGTAMTVAAVSLESEILAALHTVTDPELDQPITDWASCDRWLR